MRQKTVVLKGSNFLDTLSIIPNSEIIRSLNNEILNDSLFQFNYSKSELFVRDNSLIGKKVTIIYRVFPFNFSKPYPEFPLIINDTTPLDYTSFSNTYSSSEYSKDKESTLNVNGNITRGVSVGNAQNMVINSNLNLQLSGELSNGLFIEALLSDKNIPVQPDGYTQQIQEFDQVYIRIFDSIRSLQMGDVEINGSNSHFLKFNRRILGGRFTNQNIKLSEKTTAKSEVSAAISKGNFNRTEFLGIEGVQGPYKLKGANSETYIIILAGTEKIYLDGLLLERGENADYVINYNTAELSFTPKHFVTKDSRIIAEFEYSDKNYNRFLFYTQNQVKHSNGTYSIQYFAEGDAKNQPVNQLLTDEHKRILADAGNDPLKAVVPNYDSVGFNKNFVLYKMVDTLVNGISYDSILVYSTNPDSAFYQVGFALVGENRGNYIRDVSSANGKVHKWIAPVNNIPQGDYAPVQLLIAPQKQQMLVAKATYAFSEKTKNIFEIAFSDKNSNTFSDKSVTGEKGFAVKNYFEHKIKAQNNNLVIGLTYELAQKNFNPVERYRNAEFNRDWNLLKPILKDEHLLIANLSLHNKKANQISLISEHLNYGSDYKGYKNSLVTRLSFYKFTLSGSASMLNSKATVSNSQFYRHNFKLTRPVWRVKLGIKHDFETNQQKHSTTDSLLANSRKYSLTEAFISSNDSSKNIYSLSYKNRLDFLPFQNSLTLSSETNDIVFNTQLKSNRVHNLKSTIVWRKLKIVNSTIDKTNKNEQNLLARIDHQANFKKRTMSFFTFYEIGTGLEARKEFSYIEVAPGQGVYVWVDYNSNGIPELNEFEISPFPEEANYLRVYTPTNDYIKVYSLKFNETIRLDPSRIWRNEDGFKKLISRFKNTFTFRAMQKHTQNDFISRINPFPGYVNDTSQMNRNVSFRNTLSFNRTHPKFGVDYIYSLQNQKNLLANGFDVSDNLAHQIKIRWNVTSELLILNRSDIQLQEHSSEFYSEKNYLIESVGNITTLQWQPTTKFRTSINYKIKNKVNQLGSETALLQEAGPEVKFNSPKQGMISAKASIIINEYLGELNVPVAYTLLEGYQPGENYRWSVNFSRNVNKFLQINLSYTGRKPAESPVIHTGQFSISAVF